MTERLLLDTNIIIGAFVEPKRLSVKTRARLSSAETLKMVSAASLWELAIKKQKTPSSLAFTPAELLEAIQSQRVDILDVTPDIVVGIADAERHHGDPFDHLIMAHARSVKATLITSDRMLGRYEGDIEVVALKP